MLAGNLCLMTQPGDGGPPAAGPGRPGQARSGRAPRCSTRRSSSPTSACGRCRVDWLDEPYHLRRQSGRLRARRVGLADLRRQLQLARADLVPGQLPDDRGAAGVSSLLRLDPDRRAAALESGHAGTLDEAAAEIADRLTRIFLRDSAGRRPVLGEPGYSSPIPTGATTFRSMSTSTATTARAWGPATRPAGRPWSPS